MFKVILIILLCICVYTIGEEKGKKDVTKLIKQYWKESTNINEFLEKFTILWNEYARGDDDETT